MRKKKIPYLGGWNNMGWFSVDGSGR